MATMKDLLDRTRELSANAFEKVAGGLRGQPAVPATPSPVPVTPAAAPSLATDTMAGAAQQAEGYAKPSTAVTPYDPVRGQSFTPGDPAKTFTTTGNPTMAEAQSPRTKADVFGGEAQRQGLRAGNSGVNPNVRPGVMSPEAAAYRGAAQPTAGTPPMEPGPVPKPGMMSRLKGGAVMLGRGAGAVQAGFGVKNLVEGDYGNAADNIFQGAATMVHPGIGFIGNALTGLRDAGLRAMIGKRFETGNIIPQPPRGGDGGGGGDVPPAPTNGVRSTDYIDTTDNGRATPEALIGHEGILPVEGQGAFKRTTKGSEGPAYKVGARTDMVTPGGVNPAGLRANTLAGHMVNLATLGAQAEASAAKEHGALSEANLGIRAAQAGVQIKKAKQEIAAAANTALDKSTGTHIAGLMADKGDQYGLGGKRGTGTLGVGGESADQFKDRAGQAAAETNNRIASTLANRKDGRNLEDVSDTELQQLYLLDRIRRKVDNGRGDKVQSLRDLIGNKRFDSNDLYSYAPVAKMPSLIPGQGSFHFQLANGNTITANRAKGGEWNYVSPNGPVDSDVAEFFTKQLEQQNKKGK